MSKYMAMGMTIEDIVTRATWNAAKSLKREDLGQLSEGAGGRYCSPEHAQWKLWFCGCGGK